MQHRICWTKHAAAEPGFRAAVSGRFDDPLGAFETLYCAPTFGVCYAETLLRERFNAATNQYEVPKAEHERRSLSLLMVDFSKLKIVDLYGPGLQAMGLNNMDLMGEYQETRELARAMYQHADAPDGMVYLSRFAAGQQPAIVLFDRAKPHVRLLPGFPPVALLAIPEAFTALTQMQSIALV
ncbi:hypothetical protein os1_08270 [Comamonadaceae bacterium OS-1]|nr:hypothetical protein os1_08270 [Comamonadaceae bacterium OS-1]